LKEWWRFWIEEVVSRSRTPPSPQKNRLRSHFGQCLSRRPANRRRTPSSVIWLSCGSGSIVWTSTSRRSSTSPIWKLQRANPATNYRVLPSFSTDDHSLGSEQRKYETPQPLILQSQDAEQDLNTTISQITGWIDYAVANKRWLIIMFRRVDDTRTCCSSISVTHQLIQETADYLVQRQVYVVTNNEESLLSKI